MTAPNTETTARYKQLSDGGSEGLYIGQSATDKVGFYGTAPAAQQAIGSMITTTGMNTGTSGIFTSTTKSQEFITAVMAIQTALKTLGISS
jgi:hypothetical protein